MRLESSRLLCNIVHLIDEIQVNLKMSTELSTCEGRGEKEGPLTIPQTWDGSERTDFGMKGFGKLAIKHDLLLFAIYGELAWSRIRFAVPFTIIYMHFFKNSGPWIPLLPILGALQNTSEELQELFRTREAANSCWALKSGLPYQFECGINSWFKKGTWYLWAYFVLELFCKGWEVHKNKLSFAESYEAAALTVRGKLLDPLFSAVVLKAFLAGSSCCVWDFVMLVTSRD